MSIRTIFLTKEQEHNRSPCLLYIQTNFNKKTILLCVSSPSLQPHAASLVLGKRTPGRQGLDMGSPGQRRRHDHPSIAGGNFVQAVNVSLHVINVPSRASLLTITMIHDHPTCLVSSSMCARHVGRSGYQNRSPLLRNFCRVFNHTEPWLES